jgi:hypothetical protein
LFWLKVKDVNWTFVTPASRIVPEASPPVAEHDTILTSSIETALLEEIAKAEPPDVVVVF